MASKCSPTPQSECTRVHTHCCEVQPLQCPLPAHQRSSHHDLDKFPVNCTEAQWTVFKALVMRDGMVQPSWVNI